MMHPERSDVDISVLFNWKRPIDIVDTHNKVILSCFIRLVGDAELNRSRVYALRKSAEIRKLLKAGNSDERLAYIADKDGVNEEDLVNYILILKNKDIAKKAYQEVEVKYPKEPRSDASLEEQERYQAEVDSFGENTKKQVKDFIDRAIREEESKLRKANKENLYQIYERLVIDEIAETTMISSFRDSCVYYGTYKDEEMTERLFPTIDKFLSLPTDIKDQFMDAYESLEIDVETLKKSPVPMQ